MAHPPRIPVWLSQDQPVVYFITICEMDRRRVWDNEVFFGALERAVEKLLVRRLWFVLSAVVMPDHFHLLAAPLESRDQKVGNLSGALKRWTREAITKSGVGLPSCDEWDWQPGSFDRLLRSEESAQGKWEYMRENPVRGGLAVEWSDWPWSIGFREPRHHL
jgi:putative transposase